MRIFNVLKFLYKAEHPHFLSVDHSTYKKWKYLILLSIRLNKKYKSCEIYRKEFKNLRYFVVVGLKWSGKNVKRRTSGFAKVFIEENSDSNCIYCDKKLNNENATADHIVPISEGGNNTKVNLVVCCKDCNNERGNTDFKTFMYLKKYDYNKFI